MNSKKIGFIGAGKMASALAAGFSKSNLINPSNITCYDISDVSLTHFCNVVPGCGVARSAQDLVENADWVFLAVKPQIIPEIISELSSDSPEKLYISVMGGISLQWLVSGLNSGQVIRTMPNTPCLIGKGAVGLAANPDVATETVQSVQLLFESVGITEILPEKLLDAVTGLSGSGPAFVFQFIEALSDGGVHAGLPREIANRLAAQTVIGAGELVLQTGDHPGLLKDRVASPAGTTIAGIKALEEGGLRAATMHAVQAATARSIELGNN